MRTVSQVENLGLQPEKNNIIFTKTFTGVVYFITETHFSLNSPLNGALSLQLNMKVCKSQCIMCKIEMTQWS